MSKDEQEKLKDRIELHSLSLGEYVVIGIWRMTRIPGGWIASLDYGPGSLSQFIPFHNEFYATELK